MPNLMNIANAETQDAIVTFGRDMSVAESTTMTITENGTYDVRKKATVIVEVEGNPNHKETLTGTCDALTLPEGFMAAMETGDASASMMVDLTALSMGEVPLVAQAQSETFLASLSAIQSSLEYSAAISFAWSNAGALVLANALVGGQITDLSAMAANIPYTLTLYYHTMPEEA